MTKSELLKVAKPILFNTEMVQAILEGKKTVTRRVAKFDNYISCDEESGKYTLLEEDGGYSEGWTIQELKLNGYIKPRYRKGDILYVRETWCRNGAKYLYKAGCPNLQNNMYIKWKPSIHMPKKAARIFLKVTDVRVERLQEITTDECRNEGCCSSDCLQTGRHSDECKSDTRFINTWNSTIKKQDIDKYSWQANPWVWVYKFERVEI